MRVRIGKEGEEWRREREREQIIFWTTAPTTTKSDAFLD